MLWPCYIIVSYTTKQFYEWKCCIWRGSALVVMSRWSNWHGLNLIATWCNQVYPWLWDIFFCHSLLFCIPTIHNFQVQQITTNTLLRFYFILFFVSYVHIFLLHAFSERCICNCFLFTNFLLYTMNKRSQKCVEWP